MALATGDETDLLLPLLRGGGEASPFATFLDKLKRRTGAAVATLLIRTDDDRDALSLFAGPDIVRLSRVLQLDDMSLTARIHYDRLRPGRVYGADELDDHDPVRKARRARDMRQLGLADQRAVRLLAEESLSAWLVIASARSCTAADSALLSSLAPYAAEAVRSFVAMERHKLGDALNTQGLARAGTGWMLFDRTARLLAIAPTVEALLERSLHHAPKIGQRLRALGLGAERTLAEAAAQFDKEPDAAPRPMLLLDAPRVEALLMPAGPVTRSDLEAPAMIAHYRFARPSSPSARAALLAGLHGLPKREAELAVRLAEGSSLAEAASAMGLTIETTRNYSKRLFAALGVRGQADLVRAVHLSCAMLG